MRSLVEIYILLDFREKKIIESILKDLSDCRSDVAEEYFYPEYTEPPLKIFSDVGDLMSELQNEKEETYSIYWNTDDKELDKIMLFYTEDSKSILGLVTDEKNAESYFNRFIKKLNIKFGYVSFDSPPPENSLDFIRICQNSAYLVVRNGKIINPG